MRPLTFAHGATHWGASALAARPAGHACCAEGKDVRRFWLCLSRNCADDIEGGVFTVPTTASEFLRMAKDAGVQIVDFRFCDLLGSWQHTSKSIEDVDEEIFESGVGFDGSS